MSTNLTKHNFLVSRDQREKINGHPGIVIWFTGLSASGKSTIANALDVELNKRGLRTYILDGDNVRMGLNKDLGFSPESRKENIRRISEVAKLFADSGTIVMTAFISPYKKDRESAREVIDSDYVEVFVNTPVEECINRDPKGLYKKARKGEIANFTGVTCEFEKPADPDLHIETQREEIEESIRRIFKYIHDRINEN